MDISLGNCGETCSKVHKNGVTQKVHRETYFYETRLVKWQSNIFIYTYHLTCPIRSANTCNAYNWDACLLKLKVGINIVILTERTQIFPLEIPWHHMANTVTTPPKLFSKTTPDPGVSSITEPKLPVDFNELHYLSQRWSAIWKNDGCLAWESSCYHHHKSYQSTDNESRVWSVH